MAKTEKTAFALLIFLLVTGVAAKFYRLKDEPVMQKVLRHEKKKPEAKIEPVAQFKAERPPAILNLNQASAQELEKLPYVGKPTALKIVAYRQEHGPFKEKSDLLRVDGISIALYKKLEPHLTVQ